MATIKISELEEVTELSTSDVLPIINENETKKVSLEKLNEILGGNNDVDLSNYYTKEETNSAISTNLSNYSTTTQMNEALGTKQPLLTAGDNITIIDNVISATGGAEGGSTSMGNTEVYNMIETELNSTENLTIFTKIVNDYINSEYKQNAIVVINQGSYPSQNAKNGTIICSKVYKQTDAIWGMEGYYQVQYWSSYNYEPQLCFTLITLSCTTNEDGSKTVTQARRGETHRYGLLHKENTKSYTPTADYHPATKKYVDDTVARVATLPTASASNLGKIYQYTGETTDTYTKGYFYTVISGTETADDGTQTTVYSYAGINVQDGIKILKDFNGTIQDLDIGYYIMVGNCVINGEYMNANGGSESLLMVGTTNGDAKYGICLCGRTNIDSCAIYRIYGTNSSGVKRTILNDLLTSSNTTAYTPSGDYNPATKKYVDDAITSAITSVMEAEY